MDSYEKDYVFFTLRCVLFVSFMPIIIFIIFKIASVLGLSKRELFFWMISFCLVSLTIKVLTSIFSLSFYRDTIKLYVVKILIKYYNYSLCKNLLFKIGIDDLDLRSINIPKDKWFFFNLNENVIYDVKLPYIDFDFYILNAIRFQRTTFTKPDDDSKIQSFVETICKLNAYDYIYNLPSGDYSNVSFEKIGLWATYFDRECILPKEVGFLQRIKKRDLTEAELPVELLRNIHLYDLNNVKISLDLHDWYKDILTPSQIALIMRKYPSQINKNIILPR